MLRKIESSSDSLLELHCFVVLIRRVWLKIQSILPIINRGVNLEVIWVRWSLNLSCFKIVSRAQFESRLKYLISRTCESSRILSLTTTVQVWICDCWVFKRNVFLMLAFSWNVWDDCSKIWECLIPNETWNFLLSSWISFAQINNLLGFLLLIFDILFKLLEFTVCLIERVSKFREKLLFLYWNKLWTSKWESIVWSFIELSWRFIIEKGLSF